MVYNIGAQNSLLQQFMAELRDENVQRDTLRFRRNLERVGEIFALEISKKLEYEPKEIQTSLGTAIVPQLKQYPVLASILRAGLPLHTGLLNFFDRSDNAFISAYREHRKDDAFAVQIEYVSCPDLEGKVLILCDPMLATGHSFVGAYKALTATTKPKSVHLVSVVASVQGIEKVQRMLPKKDIHIWVAAIDDELTAQGYIVPGLGDAGDLAFGKKE